MVSAENPKKSNQSRHDRQVRIIGEKAQTRLASSKIAIIGVGALGSVCAEILARAGVPLILFDRDIVESSNLQRQFLFEEADVGLPKASCAARHLRRIDTSLDLIAYDQELTHENIVLLHDVDLIIDCTDNLYTRFLINEYAIRQTKCWIYGAAVGEHGNVCVFPAETKTARFDEIYTQVGGLETCQTAGVIATVTAITGALQADLAIRTIVKGAKESVLYSVNMDGHTIRHVRLPSRDSSTGIKKEFPYLEGKKATQATPLCGNDVFQIRTQFSLSEMCKRHQQACKLQNDSFCVICYDDHRFTLFKDNRLLVHATNAREARRQVTRYLGL